MSGISIEASLRKEEAQAELQRLLGRMGNRRGFLDSVADFIMSRSKESFAKEVDPDGKPWTPHRPSTIRSRKSKRQLPLTILRSNSRGKSGSPLAGSVNKVVTDIEARIGSPKEYAAIHQLGGTIQRSGGPSKIYRKQAADGSIGRRFVKRRKANLVTDVTVPAYTITIPARPFIGISTTDEEGIMDLARDWLTR